MWGSLTNVLSCVLFVILCMANISDSQLLCTAFPDLPISVSVPDDHPVETTILSINNINGASFTTTFLPTFGEDIFDVVGFDTIDLVVIMPLDYAMDDSYVIIFNPMRAARALDKRSLDTFCYVNITITQESVPIPEAPVFPEKVYYIQVYEGEARTNLTVVTTNITDSDEDDVITFSIENPRRSPFLIDPQSALLSYVYDYNIDENFESEVVVITLQATDSYGLSAEAFLVVTILNINDNEPQFSVTDVTVHLSSLTPRNADIFNMVATDADGDLLMYDLAEADGHSYFRVIEGKVKLISELDTDETMILHVIASDGLWESTATVTVSIIPCDSNTTSSAQTSNKISNDNSCSTSTASLSWSIPLTLALGTAALMGFILLLRKKKKGEEKDGNKVNPIDDDPIPDVA